MIFRKELRKIWKDLEKTNDYFLSEMDGKLDITSMINSVDDILKIINSRKRELNKEFTKDYEFQEKLIGLVILEHTSTFLLLDSHFGIDSKKGISKDKNKSIKIATILLHQMNNNMVVFSKLLNDGFSFQANIIFRNIIEQGSTIFAILLSESFLNKYKENPGIQDEKERIQHWFKHLSPSKIDKVLSVSISEIENLKDLKDTMFEYKKIIYSESSEFVHSQLVASLMSSYSSKKDEGETVDANLFGRVDTNIDRVLIRFFSYMEMFFRSLIQILNKKHDFKFGEIDNVEAMKLWAMYNIRREMSANYYKYCS